ncbi:hypothetical protein BC792_12049 [Sphingobacterium allocomposti]|uniref:Uncharacterized protein n=1 Tax=Sphingobacterium allocomposti TaxID=415956 RepID=A0A5S5D5T9_9SPHI|nr:hypothetical protein [Sphingobacterium composti Yoo et al. 2007 non Ten et al. 2007]TYP91341.1 hypothetical protein BC792_12049 [Sphingobacterium composti Yoo et al. 2007 non Ten et al. 2007]
MPTPPRGGDFDIQQVTTQLEQGDFRGIWHYTVQKAQKYLLSG